MGNAVEMQNLNKCNFCHTFLDVRFFVSKCPVVESVFDYWLNC